MFSPRYLVGYIMKKYPKLFYGPMWFFLCLCCIPEALDSCISPTPYIRFPLHILLYIIFRQFTKIAPNRKHVTKFEFHAQLSRWVRKKDNPPYASKFWPLPTDRYISTPRFWRSVAGVFIGHSILTALRDFVSYITSGMMIIQLLFEMGQLMFGLSLSWHCFQQKWRAVLGMVFYLMSYFTLSWFQDWTRSMWWFEVVVVLPLHLVSTIIIYYGIEKDAKKKDKELPQSYSSSSG